jgi:hypothetical protein
MQEATNLSAIFRQAAMFGDEDLARIDPPARATYRKEVECILLSRDYERMTEALGSELLADLDEVLRSTAPPVFVTADGELTYTGRSLCLLADIPQALQQ